MTLHESISPSEPDRDVPRNTVYIVARGEHPPAAPFDIVARILAREQAVVTVGSHEWHEQALTMPVVVDAPDAATARGVVEGAVARNGDVWRRFAFSTSPLVTTPRTW
jgi:hypothetical protein